MTPRFRQYQDYLKRELASRVQKNPSYSLRAFARDLELSPSKLSEILREVSGLSGESAERIADKLRFSQAETRHFITLVRSRHDRSRKQRESAQEKLRTMERENDGPETPENSPELPFMAFSIEASKIGDARKFFKVFKRRFAMDATNPNEMETPAYRVQLALTRG